MAAYFELNADHDGEFRFVLKTSKHEILLVGHPYASKQAARLGIESVRRNSRLAARYVRLLDNEAACQFVVVSDVGRVVGSSATYASRAAMEDGIKAVMSNGATTVIRETRAAGDGRVEDPLGQTAAGGRTTTN